MLFRYNEWKLFCVFSNNRLLLPIDYMWFAIIGWFIKIVKDKRYLENKTPSKLNRGNEKWFKGEPTNVKFNLLNKIYAIKNKKLKKKESVVIWICFSVKMPWLNF